MPAPSPKPAAAAAKPKSDEPCRFFLMKGTCKKGDACEFRHTLPEKKEKKSKKVKKHKKEKSGKHTSAKEGNKESKKRGDDFAQAPAKKQKT